MRTTKPVVRRWKWAKTANSKWSIDGLRNERGKRIRKFFPTREDADEWLRLRRSDLQNQGRAAMGLKDAQRVDAVKAIEILAPFGASLVDAARVFEARAKLLSRTVTFAELRAEVEAAKKADRKSTRHLGDLRSRLSVFGRAFDARPVATIETREIDDWLRSLQLSPTSRINFRKVLSVAFEFAVTRGYANENAVAKTARVAAADSTPGILKPEEVAALLAAADPAIVPAIALAAFAGLRDAEVARIKWDSIDLFGGHIKIGQSIAKTASRRIIPISDNLRLWLAPHVKPEGLVRVARRLTHLRYLAARAKGAEALETNGSPATNLRHWPTNALRHSYASYRMAEVGNAATVAEECGNSVQVLRKNYRELVTKAEAARWFAVTPRADAGASQGPTVAEESR
jgi:integrase